MRNDEQDVTNTRLLRIEAERLLKENKVTADRLIMETDTKKLVHELQVHQIELEMQNDELRQAYLTAETALKKYTMLYDLAPMGYLTLDRNGTITELNFTAAEMLGERRFSIENTNFKLFVSEKSKPVFNQFFHKIYSNSSKESCEVVLGNDNNPLCLVYMEGIVSEDNNLCLLSLVDVSNFRK